jgi:hypothetical protein
MFFVIIKFLYALKAVPPLPPPPPPDIIPLLVIDMAC